MWTTGQVAERCSSRAGTCWMDCLIHSLCTCRAVWSAAAMLPRQPCSRSRGGRSGYPAAFRTGGSRFSGDTPCRPPLPVSRSLECGSHAAAPAVLAIRCVAYPSPSWSRGCCMCSCRSSSWSDMNAIPACRRLCCTRFVLAYQRPRSAPDGNGDDTHAGWKPAPRVALAARPNAA